VMMSRTVACFRHDVRTGVADRGAFLSGLRILYLDNEKAKTIPELCVISPWFGFLSKADIDSYNGYGSLPLTQ